jgi:hypothetical protein
MTAVCVGGGASEAGLNCFTARTILSDTEIDDANRQPLSGRQASVPPATSVATSDVRWGGAAVHSCRVEAVAPNSTGGLNLGPVKRSDGLPQFDPIPLRIGYPAEPTDPLHVLRLVGNVRSVVAQLREHRV